MIRHKILTLLKINSDQVEDMFNIEVKFKIQEREVSWDRFASAFPVEALKTTFDHTWYDRPPSHPPQRPGLRKPGRAFVNINEAARLLGIGPSTVRAYVARRKISSVRIARRVLISWKQ